jgi:ABC-2 type transport system ATP-binding protein
MIEVSGLTKYYGSSRAIYDLDFIIEAGHIVGFLGLNGAGKTTALKILAGFLLPTAGTVKINGIDLLADPEQLRAQIGYLPEKPPLYDEMTVSGYLTYLGRLRGMSSAEVSQRLPGVLERTALTSHKDETVGTLSLGFRKRVGIAQAIMHDPKLLILDEPISGLDPVQIVEMRGLIKGLGGDHTILISSHILSEVEATCDHLLVLNDGELVGQGTEEEILTAFSHSLHFNLSVQGDFEAVGELLASHPLVTELNAGRRRGDLATWSVVLDRDEPAVVAHALIEAGFGLHRLEASRGQLESAFLALTRTGGPA